jgi:hypothetical protein
MVTPANITPISGVSRPTAFKPGQSGNPKGRTPGTRNRVTIEVREAASQLVDDAEYRQRLRERLLDGTAGPIEFLLWQFAYGKPPAHVEHGERGPIAEMTNQELKAKLLSAIKTLDGCGEDGDATSG